MKAYPVKFEVREGEDGWQLFALPCHNVGWAPIAMTRPRGTPGGALVEFASGLYRLTHHAINEPASADAVREAIDQPVVSTREKGIS